MSHEYVSDSELSVAVDPMIAGFAAQSTHNDLARNVSLSMHEGHNETYLVPALQFVLDATLAALNQPIVADRLSNIIAERALTAQQVVKRVVDKVIDQKALIRFYQHDELTPFGQSVEDIIALATTDSMSMLAESVFSDGCAIAGGGIQVLEDHKLTTNVRGALKRSRGLLMLANYNPDYSEELHEHLGTPYIDPANLRLTSADPARVAFTPEARDYILAHSRRLGGCPAKHVISPAQPMQTVLTEGTHQIIDYLVPDGAIL